MNIRYVIVAVAALGWGACASPGNALPPNEGATTEAGADDEEAAVPGDDGAPAEAGARNVSGSGGCEDPDRPGQMLSRECETACGRGTQQCVDNRWTACTAREPEAEVCDNRVDDDCDGQTDEDCGECMPGRSRPCASRPPAGQCRGGMQVCGADRRWGACLGEVGPAEEVCDGVDNDCNGAVDEALTRSCAGACGAGMQACVGGAWSACSGRSPTPEVCNGVDDDCNGVVDGLTRSCAGACGAGSQRCDRGAWGACSGRAPSPEVCNGVDDNCDGRVDEGLTRACNNACGAGVETCAGGSWAGCSAPRPQAEVCDLRDNNCDGRVDEGLTAAYTFINRCNRSRVFVSLGCNACARSCSGTWVEPGATWTTSFAQGVCYEWSVFARTPGGNVCLDRNTVTNAYNGPVWRYCNGDCRPDSFTMSCPSGY